jgi:hypothetical protein
MIKKKKKLNTRILGTQQLKTTIRHLKLNKPTHRDLTKREERERETKPV